VAGWGKLVAGALIGVAGTVYATNEEVRKRLPKAAQDLPDAVRHRFERAVTAARDGASSRREEILRELGEHGGERDTPVSEPQVQTGEPRETKPRRSDGPLREPYEAGDNDRLDEFFAGNEDDTRSLPRVERD
jgi:hypothetical protein